MRPFLLVTLFAGVSLAQTEPNVIIVSANRTLSAAVDQVSIEVDVLAGLTTPFDDVVAALQPAKITAANFISAGAPSFYEFSNNDGSVQQGTQWSFSTAVAFADLPGYISTLTALQTTLSTAQAPMGLYFFVQGASSSTQATTASQCPYPAVFNDAFQQAQKMAAAAGLRLGPVFSLSDTVESPASVVTVSVPSTFLYQGAVGIISGLLTQPRPGGSSGSGPGGCALTVKFQIAQ